MATRKTEARPTIRREPVRIDESTPARKDAEVLHARLAATDEPLSLDDNDFGGDPYNSTGRFTAIKADQGS